MTVSQLLQEWMLTEQQSRIKTPTYTRYKSLIQHHILPILGTVELEALDKQALRDLLGILRQSGNLHTGKGLSPSSINLVLSVLSKALEYAGDRDLIPYNPCMSIRRESLAEHRRVDAFTRDEQRRLEEVIEQRKDDRLIGILLCLYSGLRIGELLALEWSDLSEDCKLLSVTKSVYRVQGGDGHRGIRIGKPKTAASNRCIPLPNHMARRLVELKARRRGSYVVTDKRGDHMSTRSYQYIFSHLTEHACIRRLNFHALRHTFATRALENGVDIKTLSEVMGHKNASITLNRYAHSLMETKIRMMGKMTRVWEGSDFPLFQNPLVF